jgi:hypothetical protein
MRRGLAGVFVGILTLAGALIMSAPAGAVQTTTWGITPAPTSQGQRSSLVHAADGSTVHDAVIVYNRTAKPIIVHLYVLTTSYANGVYQFSPPKSGLAADTSLGASSVKLGGYQEVRVPVTIHMPRGVRSQTLAGIGAEASAINDGSLSIMEQLVVLVKANPTNHFAPPPITKDLFPWAFVAIALIVLTGVFVERERRRSRAGRSSSPLRPPLPAIGPF